jgi:hypothetical protein
MTEADCLAYCYERGYDWGGLYEHFRRVSCWCCPLQSLPELRALRKHYPDLWQKLREWDEKTWRKFRRDYSVEELDIRFDFEDERIAAGLPIKDESSIPRFGSGLTNTKYHFFRHGLSRAFSFERSGQLCLTSGNLHL